MKQPHILIIDDEENLRHMLSVMLRKQGFVTDTAANGADGLKALGNHVYDFILCDIRMPVMDGREFLRQALLQGVTSPIIMMTAYGTVDTAVACMQDGAYDFISKPFKRDEIVIVLKKRKNGKRLKEENQRLRSEIRQGSSFTGLIGRNPAMRQLFEQIHRVACLKTTVLIQGESGTGKELVARAIHADSGRAVKPFVAVNCGALAENLLESELFGHVKGLLPGLCLTRPTFEQADGGTLFLDEVGEMSVPLQIKLLRVLQEGETRRVGGTETRAVDVRIISATARDLSAEVTAGRFREDLFFRLNVFTLTIIPLRDRIDDLPLLAEHLLSECAGRVGRAVLPRLAPECLRRLMSHTWPGNVRELENVIERGLVLCDGELLGASCLSVGEVSGTGVDDASLSIKQAERTMEIDLIRKALARTGGNRTHAARELEISHRALLYKLKEYGLE